MCAAGGATVDTTQAFGMIRRERRGGEDCGRGRGAARYVHGMPETSSTLSTSLSSCRCKCLMSLSELSGADASRNIFITAQTRGRWAAGDKSEEHPGLENVQTSYVLRIVSPGYG